MLKKQIVLATKNKNKVKELQDIMNKLPWEILTCEDIENYPEISETGTTFEENAWIKAKAICELTGKIAVADDSGLEIDYLDGLPGITSARFAGDGASFAERNEKVLKLLEGVPIDKRNAQFVCVAALLWPSGRTEFFKGICKGKINFKPSGKNGFGYDPIFYLPSDRVTMAELNTEIKNKISHRAIAFKKLVDFLSNEYEYNIN